MSNDPSVKKKAFDCPHCGAFTTQFWYQLYAGRLGSENNSLPITPSNEEIERKLKDNPESDLNKAFEKLREGLIFLAPTRYGSPSDFVFNLHLSLCYNCSKVAMWIGESLVFPGERSGAIPNSDLNPDIVTDFEEARLIVRSSPRGAAALMRLCVQKLCIQLGEPGKNINEDIASLVRNGLSPLIQKSLDIVRVIGNEAVHPGAMDIKDDQETAMTLFELVNSICDQMITHPKKVMTLYQTLPQSKLDQINKRDSRQS